MTGGSAASSLYIVYSEVPGGVFRTHGSPFVPLPIAMSHALPTSAFVTVRPRYQSVTDQQAEPRAASRAMLCHLRTGQMRGWRLTRRVVLAGDPGAAPERAATSGATSRPPATPS